MNVQCFNYQAGNKALYVKCITQPVSKGQRQPTTPTSECPGMAFNSIYNIN